MKKVLFLFLLSVFICPIVWSCPSAADCNKSEMCKANQYYDKGEYRKAYSLYLKKANTGDAEAQTKVAEMFKNGKGVKQSDKKAVEWFKKVAIQTKAENQNWSIYAQSYLGKIYMYGEGVKQNTVLGMYWWGKAAEAGDAYSQDALANMYRNGHGVVVQDEYVQDIEVDAEKAIELYEKSAKQGNADAQLNLAQIYYTGKLVNERDIPQDYKKALYWYFKVATQGNAEAQTRIGIMYDQGLDVVQNYNQAFNWYSVAADKGNALAQINVAWLYENGKGVDKDIEKAAYYYNLAALQGDIAASFKFISMANDNLVNIKSDKENEAYKKYAGMMISNIDRFWMENFDKFPITQNMGLDHEGSNNEGSGVKEIYRKFFNWMKNRAENGNSYAQWALASMYGWGFGTNKNRENEFLWLKKAAEQNIPSAQNDVGLRYESDEGVNQDDQQAEYWFLRSADNGNRAAQENLAFRYLNVNGFNKYPKDVTEAYKWIIIAEGKPKPTSWWFKVGLEKMTPAECKDGERRAEEWLAQHPQYKKNDQSTH